jgi:membrane protein DedA with SNARE-associated domain
MVFPYLKGLVIIKCGLLYLDLWIYFIFNICGDYIFISILFLNDWYQITFLGQRREEFFFSFCRNFLGKKKREAHFRFI